MSADWYFLANDKPLGPWTAAQIRERTRAAPDGVLLVWKEGMSEWIDARHAPELFPDEPSKKALFDGAELARRAREELYRYLGISAYLWVCFGALLVYKTAVLRSVGVEYAPLGLALVKALVSAKFIMVLQAAKLDRRIWRSEKPFTVIVQKAALFAVFLIVLTLIEELVVGHLHGEDNHRIVSEFVGGTVLQVSSVALLMFLIMIPFFALQESGIDLWKTTRD